MLKKAKIFKDFYISPNGDNTAVMFGMVEPVEIAVKNDNFATQITVKNKNANIDLFNYKYITFDESAMFEITDVVQNNGYYTLFVQYLTDVKLNEWDEAFRIESITAQKIQRLGMSASQILQIFGNLENLNIWNITDMTRTEEQAPFMYAIRMEFSECPQDLSYALSVSDRGGAVGLQNDWTNEGVITGVMERAITFNASKPNELPTSPADFLQYNENLVAYIPIPTRKNNAFCVQLEDGRRTPEETIDIRGFVAALNSLITDLTISVNVTILTTKSIYTLYERYTPGSGYTRKISPVALDISADKNLIIIPTYDTPYKGSAVGAPINNGLVRHMNAYPVILMQVESTSNSGMAECLDFMDLYFPPLIGMKNRLLLFFEILGNKIDCSDLYDNEVTIKRLAYSLRVYKNFEQNRYEEFETSFEFNRDAYSNYDAYKKANIDLLQAQQDATLKQKQAQEREQLENQMTFQTVNAGLDTFIDAGTSFAKGNVTGGTRALVTGATSWGFDALEGIVDFETAQQNARANQRLAQQQQHEQASKSIILASKVNGSVRFLEAFDTDMEWGARYTLMRLWIFDILREHVERFERFVFDKQMLEIARQPQDVAVPEWQSAHDYIQMRITNRSILNNKKGALLYGVPPVQELGKNATLFAGADRMPTIEADTGFVGYLAGNTGARIQINVNVKKAGLYGIMLYQTGRTGQTPHINDLFEVTLNGSPIVSAQNPTVPAADFWREWSVAFGVYLGGFGLNVGNNTFVLKVKANTGNTMGNFDRLAVFPRFNG